MIIKLRYIHFKVILFCFRTISIIFWLFLHDFSYNLLIFVHIIESIVLFQYYEIVTSPLSFVRTWTPILLVIELIILFYLYINLEIFESNNFISSNLHSFFSTLQFSEICLQYLSKLYFEVISNEIIDLCSILLTLHFIFSVNWIIFLLFLTNLIFIHLTLYTFDLFSTIILFFYEVSLFYDLCDRYFLPSKILDHKLFRIRLIS